MTDTDRQLTYLRHLVATPSAADLAGYHACFRALPGLELSFRGELGHAGDEVAIQASLDHVRARKDCQDFAMAGLWRMLYRYRDRDLLPVALRGAMEAALLGTIYWFDEPGEEHCCFSSENHQVLYHSAESLAGQWFADHPFGNDGRLGHWHREHAREHLLRWLGWRLRFDFSEWNSSCYYDEDIAALLNVHDFAEDAELRRLAKAVLDLLFLHIAQQTWHGLSGCSQGRLYERHILSPGTTPSATLAQLCWGDEVPARQTLGAVSLCASEYAVPPLTAAIARDDGPAVIRERHGLDVEEAARWGVEPGRLRDTLFFWSSGESLHRDVVAMSRALCPPKHGHSAWGVQYAYRHYREAGPEADPDPSQHALTQANLYTYRTPDYMLSCAQAYRPGKPGYQQHIWQATLGPTAIVFSTNPAKAPDGRPGHWAGNGILPKAVQHRQTLICLHRVEPYPIWDQPPWYHEPYVHAWFPRQAFDEVVERGRWVFGRLGDAYVGLCSDREARWIDDHEWLVDGREALFVCELGAAPTHGSFRAFVDGLASATLNGDLDRVRYVSPFAGCFETGWERDLTVDGKDIPLRDYPRFDTPWCQAAFGDDRFRVQHGEQEWQIG